MKKLTIFLCLMFASVSAASAQGCDLLQAIVSEWGHVADTDGVDIITWRHESLPKPTAAQIENAKVNCNKTKVRQAKLVELNEFARLRICALTGICYDSWSHMVIDYHIWQSVVVAAKQATTEKATANAHYQPWKDARDTLNNFTGLASLTFYNISSGVWP